MDEYQRGSNLTIWLWSGAEESWAEAEQDIPGNRAACPAQLRARLERLADFGTLQVPEHMNREGDGLCAVKASCGLRAWGWFGHYMERRAFVISHVVLKRRQHADPADHKRALAAKAQFEAAQ